MGDCFDNTIKAVNQKWKSRWHFPCSFFLKNGAIGLLLWHKDAAATVRGRESLQELAVHAPLEIGAPHPIT